MRRAIELISLLRSMKVKLWGDGNNLRLNAPPNTITPELRQELIAHKDEILAFLRQARQIDVPTQPRIFIKPRPAVLPLSFAQERLWFLHQLEPDSSMYNVPLAFHLRGQLEAGALECSLSSLIDRHEILRTVIQHRDGSACQVILPSIPFQLTQIDTVNDWQAWIHAEANRPFDLSCGPLLRAALLRLSPDDWIFFLNQHHVVTDAWSTSLLLQELSKDYAACVKGQKSALSPSPIQYADFALWQRDYLKGASLKAQLQYWLGQLQDVPAVIELPTDYPRPAVQSHHGVIREYPLPAYLGEHLKAFCSQHGVTVFMTLMAAYQVLLYRYSRQLRFTVGMPIANRTRAELEGIIGFFINTLALRADLSGDPDFLTVLQRVREACLGAYAHQDLPFEMLVDELKLERNLSRSALFQTMFVLQNAPEADLVLPGVNVENLFIATDTSKFDLTFSVNETSGGYAVTVQYSTDLYSHATIDRMVGHYQRLLEGILDDPEQKIDRLPLLPDAERRQLLVEWNDTRCQYPQDKCVPAFFEAQVELTPGALAVICEDRQLTYNELNIRANQLAHYLREQGVAPEICVGICLERSVEVIVAMLGVMKAGGAYVPIDPALPAGRISDIIAEAHPAVILTQARLQAQIPAGIHTFAIDSQWQEIACCPTVNPSGLARPENLVYVLFTSGSTGLPKGVAVEHRQLSNYVNSIMQRLDLPRGARYAIVSTFAADLGNTVIFPALCTGSSLTIIPRSLAMNPDELADYFSRHPIDVLKIVPSHLRALLTAANPAGILPRQRLVLGGEALNWELVNRVSMLAPGCRIFNHYGPTETTVGVLTYPVPEENYPLTRNVPLGRPIGNAQVYILDSGGQVVPTGVPGELYIGGAPVARGYLNRADLTAERFIEDPFRPAPGNRLYKSGDLVRYLADGNIEFLGRIDQQVKLRGYRIELGEIETTLAAQRTVEQAVVAMKERASGDQQLVAYVIPHSRAFKGAASLEAVKPKLIAQWRDAIKQKLPEYMLPGAFVIMKQIPLNPNGKVDREALPEPDSSAYVKASGFTPPQTQEEEILAGIWAELLGLPQVGRHDNFFELGGDSILSLQFINRARAQGLYLAPRQVFEAQTIAALAKVAEPVKALAPLDPGPVLGDVPLTPIQRRFFDRCPRHPHHYNQATWLHMNRAVEADLLEQALGFLLSYHDALRLRFERNAQGWRQWLSAAQSTEGLVRRVDLSALTLNEQQNEIITINQSLQSSLNIESGPLFRVALIQLGPERPKRLLFVIHHLVVDFVSWQVLVSDLWTVYDQLEKGQPPQLPAKSLSFKAWAEWLVDDAHQEATQAQLPYWLSIGQQPVQPLPVDFPGQRSLNLVKHSNHVTVELSTAETQSLLRDVPEAYHTQINDVLLTALAQALAAWSGQTCVLVDLEGHGRETGDLDLSRTVGWFTSVFPVCLSLEGKGPGAAIKSIKEQLRRIPQKGMGYGSLRYLNPHTAAQLAALPQAEVCFNYGGQQKTVTVQSLGDEWAEDEDLVYLIYVSGAIIGDQLAMTFTYSHKLYLRETVDQLAQGFIQALKGLIDHCRQPQAGGYTPSDFPLAALFQSELDRIVAHHAGMADLYPLAPIQSMMLEQSLSAPGSGVYITQSGQQISGDLDVSRFKSAWQEAVNRHAILRTGFAWQALRAPVQVVHAQAALPWEELDWQSLPLKEQRKRLDQLMQRERQKGFDLAAPPLMRCALIRVGESRHWFVRSNHHLVMDGWSSALLEREVLERYAKAGFIAGSERPYRDYIAWLASQDMLQAERYWREQLAGLHTTAQLPVLPAEESAQRAGYGEKRLILSEAQTRALQAAAQKSRVTLAILCQAAWALALHRISGEPDVVFGVTVSGRSAALPEIEARIGPYINTLSLRVKIQPDMPCQAWLQGILRDQAMLETFAYTSLKKIETWAGSPSGAPLFQSHLRYQNFPTREKVDVEGCEKHVKMDDLTGFDWWHYPLNVVVVPGLRLQWIITYYRGYFDIAVIRQVLQTVKVMLARLRCEAPDGALSSLLLV